MTGEKWSRRQFLERAGLASGVAVAAPLWAGCTSGSSSSNKSSSRTSSSSARTTFTFAQDQAVDSMDPSSVDLSESRTYYINLYDPLIHRDASHKMVPGLAESWKNTDPTHWLFKIRQNVKFHDGKPLTAKDVVFSMKRYTDPKIYDGASNMATWAKIEALDNFTVQLTTKTPDVLVPAHMADLVFVMNEDYFNAHDKGYLAAHENGTGPYILKEWIKGDHATMTANPDYWGGMPKIKTVVIKEIPQDNTRTSALLAGEIDLDAEVVAAQLSRLSGKSNIHVASVDLPAPVYIGIHVSHSPASDALSDIRVRQALNYAVDKDAIISRILKGQGTAMGSAIPSINFGANPAVKPYPYDPKKAKSLLAEAGQTNLRLGFDTVTTGLNGIHDPSLAVAQYLEAVGIKVDIHLYDPDSFLQKLISKNLSDLWAQIFRDASMDAGGIYNALLLSTGFANNGYYVNKQVDQLLQQATTHFSPSVRDDAYKQVDVLIHEQAPWIFLYNPKQAAGMQSYVNFKPRPDLLVPVAEAVTFK